MTGFATEAMLPRLREIWIACFGDERGYADLIFSRLLRPESIFVTGEGAEPDAMLCLEPFDCVGEGETGKAAYIYGVATHPDRQGRGLSTALLEACHRLLTAEGYDLSALVPAGESLFRFYGKRGYENAFYLRKETVAADRLPEAGCAVHPAELAELSALRDEYFGRLAPFARWGGDYLSYITAESLLLGGGVFTLEGDGWTGYGVCHLDGDRVTVKELAAPENRIGEALAGLRGRLGGREYRLCLPADTVLPEGLKQPNSPPIPDRVLPFGMVRWYDKEKQERMCPGRGQAGWLTHALD